MPLPHELSPGDVISVGNGQIRTVLRTQPLLTPDDALTQIFFADGSSGLIEPTRYVHRIWPQDTLSHLPDASTSPISPA